MKHTHSLIAISLFAFIAGGCATSPDDPNANAKQKAMIGAAVGTAIGLATGDSAVERRQQAMVGAALGAAAGGGIGHYQDKQEAKLRQQLQGTGVDVSREGDNIMLDMPSGITFAFNSSDVNSQFYPVLDKVAATLNEYNQTTVNVAGHTDSVGSDSYNQRAFGTARFFGRQVPAVARRGQPTPADLRLRRKPPGRQQ